jgi:HD-like signal output (HDOD) protein/DNA-binding response OmpR family regulator
LLPQSLLFGLNLPVTYFRYVDILVVEQDDAVADEILELLGHWKMDAVRAVDVQTARTLLDAGGIDLVLSELSLPGESGVDLVRWMRDQPHHRYLPALLVSGEAGRDDIVAASQVGVEGFVARPFQSEELRQRILEVYRKNRSERWTRDAVDIWNERLPADEAKPEGPVVVFGEGVTDEKRLSDPAQRPVMEYLALARNVIGALNEAAPERLARYMILPTTTEVILSLKRPGVRDAIRVILVSTRCQGNPTLMARLFSINRRSYQATLYLVYDEVDEISAVHRQGLKDLGVRTLRRSRIDEERMQSIMTRHLGAEPVTAAEEEEEELAPQQIRSRIVDDIETMSTLPPIPQVYEKISKLARDPGSDLKEWIDVIRVDPLTCATILRQANSVNYGFKAEISQIDRAVILLGKNVVVGLVASASVRTALAAIDEKGFRLEDLWVHNLAVGFAAHILSFPLDGEVEGMGNVDGLGLHVDGLAVLRSINLPKRLGLDYASINAMAAGSLHDVGKGVMVFAYPGLFPLVRDELQERRWQIPMLEAERDVAGGLTHTTAGDILVRKWQMADQLGNSVLSHHAPAVDDGLSFLVGIADVVGQILYPFPRDGGYPLAKAFEDEDWGTARPFLPEGFLDQPLMSPAELVTLYHTIGPQVRHFTEEMRRSIG